MHHFGADKTDKTADKSKNAAISIVYRWADKADKMADKNTGHRTMADKTP